VFVVFFSPHRGSRFRPPHVAIYLRMRRIEAWCKHGRLPERPMGADCKSVGLCLRRFESYICHTKSAPILFARVGADFFCACTEVERALATQAPASAQGCRRLRGLGMGPGGWFQGECGVKLVPAKPSPAASIGATMGSGTIFAPMTSGFGAGARSCVIFRRLQESGNALLSHAPLAQSVERFHGKEKVNGSIPLGGSLDCGAVLSARHSTPRRCSSVGRANDS